MSQDKLTPQVAEFINSFPPRKRDTGDISHYPVHKKMYCYKCGYGADFYREGIFLDSKKPEKNYKKWAVTYACDLCKAHRSFKYILPEETLKFVPVKCF